MEDVKDKILQEQIESSSAGQVKVEDKTIVNEIKVETTYEDVFNKLGKKIKDKEAFDKLKFSYEKQFASSVAKNKVADLESNLLHEYSDIRADILAEKKSEERVQAKLAERDLEVKTFLEKNNLTELTDSELNEFVSYKVISDVNEVEKAKTNPIIAKMFKESLAIAKIKGQPLPNSQKTQENSNVSRNEYIEAKKNIFTRRATDKDRTIYNDNRKFFD